MSEATGAAHGQVGHQIRFEWGPTGAAAIAHGADIAVVVDVLSFTSTVTVAVGRGIAVLPYRWKDNQAAAYAERHDAVLAIGRLEARQAGPATVSLSPAAVVGAQGVTRVVLPSPNGSSICFALAETGVEVVAACLRNATAVAHALAPRVADGATVAVVAAGERWPDGSLRPSAEDLWGAGAVLAGLSDLGVDRLSPEAELAAAGFRTAAAQLATRLHGCASGRELDEAGFGEDVDIAAAVDADDVVPVLSGAEFGPRSTD